MATPASEHADPPPAPSPGPGPAAAVVTRRRRLRRVVASGLAGVLALFLIMVGAVAWYFSGQAVAVNHEVVRDVTATPVGGEAVSLTRDEITALPGRYGLEWDGGYAELGPVISSDGVTVTRRLASTSGIGRLTGRTPARVDPFAYTGDPRSAVGLAFEEVTVSGELGGLPTWYVPAAGAGAGGRGLTWVVYVHGHDSSRKESLRYLSAWHRLGLPVLVPSYRNDVGAPPSPDGVHHLGDTEWRDVEAAVRWALGRGARDVVLAGWSMGGAISLQVADRSAVKGSIRGLILDSPVVDWRDVFRFQGGERGLPRPVTDVAIWTVERRIGIDLDRFDWVARFRDLAVPTLLFASDGDTYVPSGPAQQLGRARTDLVTLVTGPRADHTRMWNVDPAGYEARMAQWLTGLGAVAKAAA